MVHASVAVTIFGIGMLIPGPFDVFFGTVGVLIFRHPIGFAIGVGAYNLVAIGVVYVGTSGMLDDVGHMTKQIESARAHRVRGFCDPDDTMLVC